MEAALRSDLNARIHNKRAEAAMRLPILRASILGLVLAASPVSLPGDFPITPPEDYLRLASSDVLACDPPSSVPQETENAYLQTGLLADDAALLWRADVYDLVDCLRRKAETI